MEPVDYCTHGNVAGVKELWNGIGIDYYEGNRTNVFLLLETTSPYSTPHGDGDVERERYGMKYNTNNDAVFSEKRKRKELRTQHTFKHASAYGPLNIQRQFELTVILGIWRIPQLVLSLK